MINHRATQKEIARRCGVSQSAVSVALGGRSATAHLGEATRRRILEAARETGYRPHAAARRLRTNRTHTLMFAPPETMAAVVQLPNAELIAISEEAARRGYGFEVATPGPAFHEMAALEAAVRESRCDGVLLRCSVATELPCWPFLRRSGIPLVVLESPAIRGVTTLSHDYRGGAVAAVQHLLRLGRRRIAFLGPAFFGGYWSEERYRGYLEAHAQAGCRADPHLHVVAPHLLRPGQSDALEAERTLRAFFLANPRVDAVFAAYDLLALEAMRTLGRLGRRVPDDVAVVGFDDEPFAQALVPSLTSVCMDPHAIGRLAVDLLVGQIEGRYKPGGHHMVPSRLIVRESTTGRHQGDQGTSSRVLQDAAPLVERRSRSCAAGSR